MKKLLFFISISLAAQTDLPGPIGALPISGSPSSIIVWDSTTTYKTGFTAGTLTGNNIWTLPTSDANGCFKSNGSYVLSIVSCGGSGTPGGLDQYIQYNKSGAFYGDLNLKWQYGAQNLAITGVSGQSALTAVTGYIQSNGGFVSNNNTWNGINSTTDGAALQGYAMLNTGSMGGYIDDPPIMYSPNPGYTCYDVWGNIVSLPIHLNNMPSGFGNNDAIIWNSTSPLPGFHSPFPTGYYNSGTPCNMTVPIPSSGLPYGININTYIFPRGGLATDQPQFNSIQMLGNQGNSGGIQAGSLLAKGIYPAGTITACCGTLTVPTYLGGVLALGLSDTYPQVGNITTVHNPFPIGLTQEAGEAYWDTTLSCVNWSIDTTNWRCAALQATSVSFINITATGQISSAGVVYSNGTGSSGGFAAPYSTNSNAIQAPNGGGYFGLGVTSNQAFYMLNNTCGLLNLPASNYGGWGFQGGSTYCYYNGTSWQSINLSSLSGGVSSLTGTANEVLVNGTTGSAQTGALTLTTPQGICTTCNVVFNVISSGASSGTAFQTSNSNFIVDYLGNVSSGGSVATFYANSTTGGFDVTHDNNYQSIQTVGGFYASGASNTGYVFTVGGVGAINNSGAFVGAGVNVGRYQGVAGRAFNPYDSGGTLWTGLDADPINGFKTVGGSVVLAYHYSVSGTYGPGTSVGSVLINGSYPPAGVYSVAMGMANGNSGQAGEIVLTWTDPNGVNLECLNYVGTGYDSTTSRYTMQNDNACVSISTNGGGINYTINPLGFVSKFYLDIFRID